MLPILFKIGPVLVPSYWFMLILSFVIGSIVYYLQVRNLGERLFDVIIVTGFTLFMTVFGAKLFSFINYIYKRELIIDQFSDIFRILLNSGLISFGGGIFAIFSFSLYYIAKDKDFVKYADNLALSMALSVFLIRIGCFLGGCCYGKVVDVSNPFGIHFPMYSDAGKHLHSVGAVKLFPSQLLASFNGLLIFFTILFYKSKKLKKGSYIVLFVGLYSLSRFIVDFTRVYENKEHLMGLTFNQYLSLVLIGCSFAFLKVRSRIGTN